MIYIIFPLKKKKKQTLKQVVEMGMRQHLGCQFLGTLGTRMKHWRADRAGFVRLNWVPKNCLNRWLFPTNPIFSGWWFQTFFIFHFMYGMSSFPLTHIFQDGHIAPPSRIFLAAKNVLNIQI